MKWLNINDKEGDKNKSNIVLLIELYLKIVNNGKEIE